ncbi:Uncharacterised protein [Clostridioides difficile]|uniref:hypothetical protein n=1 Tax=Clostridioides difficile TaxID=1496 RepID=UPI000D1E0544|nr:hypothetical protein [Clostridioides difficile]UWD43115.1 hypothetical protein NYF05_09085 [Clostridioides difficile]UWD43309.1 hypothetical protein NYU56_08830 [Clostridioides difficile]VFC53620.1 Uncharacterised protein [Clostridioides difficile]VFF94196.1 Uncharacterised protein [Clostridioides difficile]VHX67624.1 Uncharacterised protein [Clostridioides difficile]
MAKVFTPESEKIIRVKASELHAHGNAEYVVSIGTEIWEDAPHRVLKVQMSYGGKISGRRSPSYPIGTDDYKRVIQAMEKLMAEEDEE